VLYHAPLVLVSDLEVAHRVAAPGVHGAEDDGEGPGLEPRIYFQREVGLALGLGRLVESRYHDDDGDAVGPGHAPEVLYSVREWPLGRDVAHVVVVALSRVDAKSVKQAAEGRGIDGLDGGLGRWGGRGWGWAE
jgi:hypothetical protein